MRAPLGRAGDGKQKRVEVGNVSAAAGSSCEACTNLSSHMGDFTVLMTMDMDVRSNWEVMTRLVPKTAGATAAHQSKLDGGVKHLNISGVPPSAYYPQTLHIDLRATAVVWKKTYECLLAEGVETAVKQICALRGIKLKLGERTETAQRAGRKGIFTFRSGDLGKVLKYVHRGPTEGLLAPLQSVCGDLFESLRIVWKLESILLELITSRHTYTERWPEVLIRGITHGLMLDSCLDVRSPSIHQLGHHVWWHVRDLGRFQQSLRMVNATLYGASEHGSECKHGDLRLTVKTQLSKATPPAPALGVAGRLLTSGGVGALSNWPGKKMHNVLAMLIGLAKKDQQTWSCRQIFPRSCARAQGEASLARSVKRARHGSLQGSSVTYATGAAGLPVDMNADTVGEHLKVLAFFIDDRVETPSGVGTVVQVREDGTYDVQLDSSGTVQNFDGPTMKEETTHFDAAAEDSDDAEQNERRRERMERLTMDKSSIGERAGANANAVADKCELQNWCVSEGQTVKADKSQIGIGDKAVLKVSYATNSVCVEGSQAGGDGRVKKVTVVVHKWALVDT